MGTIEMGESDNFTHILQFEISNVENFEIDVRSLDEHEGLDFVNKIVPIVKPFGKHNYYVFNAKTLIEECENYEDFVEENYVYNITNLIIPLCKAVQQLSEKVDKLEDQQKKQN